MKTARRWEPEALVGARDGVQNLSPCGYRSGGPDQSSEFRQPPVGSVAGPLSQGTRESSTGAADSEGIGRCLSATKVKVVVFVVIGEPKHRGFQRFFERTFTNGLVVESRLMFGCLRRHMLDAYKAGAVVRVIDRRGGMVALAKLADDMRFTILLLVLLPPFR